MPRFFRTRTDQMTQAVNTFAAISTNPDGTDGGSVIVPPGVNKLKKLLVTLSLSAEVATDTGGVITLRMTGDGLRDGQQDIVVGGFSCIAQGTPATGIVNQDRPYEVEVDLPVTVNGQVSLSAAYSGVDFGTPEIGVTCVFE